MVGPGYGAGQPCSSHNVEPTVAFMWRRILYIGANQTAAPQNYGIKKISMIGQARSKAY